MTLRRIAWAMLLVAAVVSSRAYGEDAGRADFDKAVELKINASDLGDLQEVITLCQSAIDKGLSKDDSKFCRSILGATLTQRAGLLCELLQGGEGGKGLNIVQMFRVRQAALSDLESAIKYDPDQGQAHFLIARLHALPGGNPVRAIKALGDAIDHLDADDPTRVKALMLRATLSPDPKQRLADFDEAMKLGSKTVELLLARAQLLFELGKLEESLADLNEVQKLDEKHAGSYQARGIVLAAQGKTDEAVESLSKAIELDGDSPMAHMHRGRIRAMKKDYEGALDDLTKSLALEPNNPTCLLIRAEVFLAVEKKHQAIADVQQALRVAPEMPAARRARAMLNAADGKYAEAVRDYERLVDLMPEDAEIRAQLGLLQRATKELPKAIESFNEAIKLDPKNALVYNHRGDAFIACGKHAEALADYNKVIELDPENKNVLNNLAWLLATSPNDKVRDGRRAIELALKACEATEYKASYILSTLAAGYAETGDWKNAEQWASKAVELGKDSLKPQLKKELQSYKSKKPWRELQTSDDEIDDESTPRTATKPGSKSKE